MSFEVDYLALAPELVVVATLLVVLALDLFLPRPLKYWTATVGGAPVELRRVNVGFQGVVVPPGAHVIDLRYRNTVIVWSAAVSAVMVTALLAMAVTGSRRTSGVASSNARA